MDIVGFVQLHQNCGLRFDKRFHQDCLVTSLVVVRVVIVLAHRHWFVWQNSVLHVDNIGDNFQAACLNLLGCPKYLMWMLPEPEYQWEWCCQNECLVALQRQYQMR